MAKNDYVYAVTRVHMHEGNLLSEKDVEALITAKDTAEVTRLLADKGWGGQAAEPDAILAAERDKTWALIHDVIEDTAPFAMFLYANDYHNLKAAIKLEYSSGEDTDNPAYYMADGTVPRADIIEAAKQHDFDKLPPALAQAGREAYEALAHTGNGQACDMVIDRAALAAIGEAGRASESELLRSYAQLTVDTANIKAAVRCARMQKQTDFIRRALAPAGTLDFDKLADATANGLPALYEYLRTTPYSGAVDALESGMAAFELWAGNRMIELIRPQRNNYFGIEPLAAYILARQNEIAMVRLVYSAKINGLGEELLRERLREMYV